MNDISILFHHKVFMQFGKSPITIKNNNKAKEIPMPKHVELLDLPSRLFKEKLNKLKYHSKKTVFSK